MANTHWTVISTNMFPNEDPNYKQRMERFQTIIDTMKTDKPKVDFQKTATFYGGSKAKKKKGKKSDAN